MPVHIACAYGAAPVNRPAPLKPAAHAAGGGQAANVNASASRRAESLIAAKVPGGIEFSGAAPTSAAHALSLYTRAADRVEAAVGVELGRTLDVRG